jgi:polysaccharide biosynthesis protein VpsQ
MIDHCHYKVLGRISLTILPLLYMTFIWLQSSYFNPESLYTLSQHIPLKILLLAGLMLETAHFFQFGLLYLFIIMAVLAHKPLQKNHEKWAFILSVSYGLLDEIHQIFVPFRSFSLLDLTKDVIGVLIVSYIIHRNYFYKTGSPIGKRLKNITTNLH